MALTFSMRESCSIALKFYLSVVEVTNKSARSSHQRCSINKDVLGNFAKVKEKQLCQNLFFHKVADLRHAALLKMRV